MHSIKCAVATQPTCVDDTLINHYKQVCGDQSPNIKPNKPQPQNTNKSHNNSNTNKPNKSAPQNTNKFKKKTNNNKPNKTKPKSILKKRRKKKRPKVTFNFDPNPQPKRVKRVKRSKPIIAKILSKVPANLHRARPNIQRKYYENRFRYLVLFHGCHFPIWVDQNAVRNTLALEEFEKCGIK